MPGITTESVMASISASPKIQIRPEGVMAIRGPLLYY